MAKAPVPPAKDGDPDPSMDDILASIRRILDDDDQGSKEPAGDVLVLDPSMMVAEPEPEPAQAQSKVVETPALVVPAESGHSNPVNDEPLSSPTVAREIAAAPNPAELVAPEAAAAAANSVGALMRTLAAERSATISRGAVTIEDLVREEVRPLLKSWLDQHLPPIVERLVQAEIQRVVARQTG